VLEQVRWRRPGRFLRDLNILALLVVIAAGASLLLLPQTDAGLLGLPDLVAGAAAPRTIKSPRTFAIEDPDTTERLRGEARGRERPTYDLHVGFGQEAKTRIEEAFSAAAVTQPATPEDAEAVKKERAQAFMLALGVTLEDPALMPLIKASGEDEVRDAAIMVVKAVYEDRIAEDKALLALRAPNGLQVRMVNPDGTVNREENVFNYNSIIGVDAARAKVDELVADKLDRLPLDERRAVAVLSKKLLKPNLIPNEFESERRKLAAERSVKTVVIPIKSGETLLRAGERVTERHLFILRGMEQELKQESRAQASAGSALLIVALVILIYRFNRKSFKRFNPSHRDLAFLASAYVATLLSIWMGYKGVLYLSEAFPLLTISAYRFALPVAAGALLVRFTVGAESAAAFGVVAGLTAGWMMDANLGYAAYVTAGAFAAATVPDSDHPRGSIFVAGLRSSVAQGLIVLSLALLRSSLSFEETTGEVLAALVSGLLTAILVLVVLPAVEVLFGYTTALKLTDLANLNHPLLRQLLVEAPGTYHHSIMVGTLAEAAAGPIGANRLLALAGGYYHDIGKVKNPRAFEENGHAGLATLSPIDEAKEIKLHVSDGLEIGAQHRVGQSVLEIIAQHHGTSRVRNSRRRAVSVSGRDAEFEHAGPRPSAAEAALVMLADVVEVGTRELVQEVAIDRPRIDAAVRKLVRDVAADGQLAQCELSLKDLDTIIREFTDVLDERVAKRTRSTLSGIPTISPAAVVRPPPGGEPN
jgi:cyclic-di-AMP phosphodiesterase PgpH